MTVSVAHVPKTAPAVRTAGPLHIVLVKSSRTLHGFSTSNEGYQGCNNPVSQAKAHEGAGGLNLQTTLQGERGSRFLIWTDWVTGSLFSKSEVQAKVGPIPCCPDSDRSVGDQSQSHAWQD